MSMWWTSEHSCEQMWRIHFYNQQYALTLNQSELCSVTLKKITIFVALEVPTVEFSDGKNKGKEKLTTDKAKIKDRFHTCSSWCGIASQCVDDND